MDNVIIGATDVNEAVKRQSEAKHLFDLDNMNSREFVSNNEKVNDHLRAASYDIPNLAKILGLSWKIENDNLEVKKAKFIEEPLLTGRKV